MPRRAARRRAVELLYEADVVGRDLATTLERVLADPLAEPVDGYARELIVGIAAEQAAIDAVISRHAEGWAIDRMPVLDRSVLRLATYELRRGAIPAAVAISEAVELAKTLSTVDSGRFINGVLAAVLRERGAHISHDADAGYTAEPALASPGEGVYSPIEEVSVEESTGSRDNLLVTSKVRAAIKATGKRMDSSFAGALNERIHELIEQAASKADASKRATVRPEDL